MWFLEKKSSRICIPVICRSSKLMSKSRIHVMAAVIRRAGRILIAKRPDTAHQGGLWEFPGGKLDPGEERQEGLRRELREELGIKVTSARPLLNVNHDYPDKSVRLDVWLIDGFEGEAHGAEGQPIRWVLPAELSDYDFPRANGPIVVAAQLPELYLITPGHQDMAQLVAGLEAAREREIYMVQLRQTGLSPEEYDHLAGSLLERFGSDFIWLLKGSAMPENGAGWHLTASQLRGLYDAGWRRGNPFPAGPPVPPGTAQTPNLEHRPASWWERPPGREGAPAGNGLLAASCHDAEELQMAAEIGADFVTLSPVLPTTSHPEAKGMGWEEARNLIAQVNIPVYLLGGLSPDDLEQAFEAGAQGIAGISGLWSSKTDD
jgi:8-oxo-dGTP diphosphatase